MAKPDRLDPKALAQARQLLTPPATRPSTLPALAAAAFAATAAMGLATLVVLMPLAGIDTQTPPGQSLGSVAP